MHISEKNNFLLLIIWRSSEIVNLPTRSRASWSVEKHLSFYNNSYFLPNATRLKYQSNAAFFFDICTNPIYFPKILAYNLSTFKTIQKANGSIHSSSLAEHERVDNILTVGFDVASSLLKKFWRPKSTLLNLIDSYVNDRFKGQFMIGIHLRYQYMSDNDIMTFAKCALEIEKEKQVKLVHIFVWKQFLALFTF